MKDPQTRKHIVLTATQMKQIARYELTFKDITEDPITEDLDLLFSGEFTYTLEDLTAALYHLRSKDPSISDYYLYWLSPLIQYDMAFGIDQACGYFDEEEDVPDELKGYEGLPVSDTYWFDDIWCRLDWVFFDDDDEAPENEEPISSILDFDRMISDLERHASNKGKPITEWEFTSQEKKNYILPFQMDDHVKNADEKQLLLARKMIDELCEEDSTLALHIKGYACYGGNALYPCDWPVSRDCILRLFEKEDDPQYANTLGYIYYYGRCTGGEPEYGKAFHYFGIAAANGLYEGMYKLADMFYHGYGCNKSEKTARKLYDLVYTDSFKHFLQGENANFADAALRMGNVYAKGIGGTVNLERAYSFYTQAVYAAKIRAADNDFFGNTTVAINAQKALEETAAALPEDYFCEQRDYFYPFLFLELMNDRFKCELNRTLQKDGEWKLTGSRIATRACSTPDYILVTLPELGICERTITASMTTVKVSEIWFKEDADRVLFDSIESNDQEDRYEFYYDDEMTAWIRCETFRVYGKKAKEASGPEYRLVTIRFQANGRSYDYLCEDEDVQVGDTVIVDGYDGETEVEVIGITIKRESELALPIERYKKVRTI